MNRFPAIIRFRVQRKIENHFRGLLSIRKERLTLTETFLIECLMALRGARDFSEEVSQSDNSSKQFFRVAEARALRHFTA